MPENWCFETSVVSMLSCLLRCWRSGRVSLALRPRESKRELCARRSRACSPCMPGSSFLSTEASSPTGQSSYRAARFAGCEMATAAAATCLRLFLPWTNHPPPGLPCPASDSPLDAERQDDPIVAFQGLLALVRGTGIPHLTGNRRVRGGGAPEGLGGGPGSPSERQCRKQPGWPLSARKTGRAVVHLLPRLLG